MTNPDANVPTLSRLSIERLVALLHAAGSTTATEDIIRADIAAGAPINEDGTVNLITYGAWLIRELGIREGGHAN
jgi:hypothetical protein